ncbi:MAG: hypothetical protein ACLQNE_01145 [Thermoguttaceae bacterium]
MTERFPRQMLTRPIPQVVVEAVEVAVNERFADAACGENRGEDKLASVSYVRELPEKALHAAKNRIERSRWQLAQDAVAGAALAVLMGYTEYSSPLSRSSVGEYLTILDDRGVTRPIMDFDDIQDQATESRGAASLRPMYLSAEDAEVISQALSNGDARPRISAAPLPEYEG